MTSILSEIAGFGRSGGLFERSVSRERFPVLSASFDASAALERGTALLIGGLDGSLGQTIRALSLTTPRLTLGSPLRFGSFQTGSLSRGLWSGGMPMFPFSGGMWPGMMGAGAMFGAPAGSNVGGNAGGSPGYTTPRRLMAQDRSTPAAATDTAASSATPAAAGTAKSSAKPAATKSGASATPAAAPAGAGKTASAGKTALTSAEKAEQQWKKAAERVVTAVQKNKGLKDAISVTANVVGRTLTITPKPGAKPSEKQLTALVKGVTTLVNGKGPLGGSALVIGGKKYDGKIAVAELVKTLMPAAPVVAKAAPSAPDPAAAAWVKAAQALENKVKTPDEAGDIAISVDAAARTIRIATLHYPLDMDFADLDALRPLLSTVIQAVNGAGPLKGSILIVGGKTYKTCSAAGIADMLQQFAAPAPSPPVTPAPNVVPTLPVKPTVAPPLPAEPIAPPTAKRSGDSDTALTPAVLADNARFAQQMLNGASGEIAGFMYSWQFGPAKELVMAKIAQIKSQLGLAADADVPPEKAEAVARALFAFAQADRPAAWPTDSTTAAQLAKNPDIGLGINFTGIQRDTKAQWAGESGSIAGIIDQPATTSRKLKHGECTEQTAINTALNALAGNKYMVTAEVFETRVVGINQFADPPHTTFHVCNVLRRPGQPDVIFDLGMKQVFTAQQKSHTHYAVLSHREFAALQAGNLAIVHLDRKHPQYARPLIEAAGKLAPHRSFFPYLQSSVEMATKVTYSSDEDKVAVFKRFEAQFGEKTIGAIDRALSLAGNARLEQDHILDVEISRVFDSKIPRNAQLVARKINVITWLIDMARKNGLSDRVRYWEQQLVTTMTQYRPTVDAMKTSFAQLTKDAGIRTDRGLPSAKIQSEVAASSRQYLGWLLKEQGRLSAETKALLPQLTALKGKEGPAARVARSQIERRLARIPKLQITVEEEIARVKQLHTQLTNPPVA